MKQIICQLHRHMENINPYYIIHSTAAAAASISNQEKGCNQISFAAPDNSAFWQVTSASAALKLSKMTTK